MNTSEAISSLASAQRILKNVFGFEQFRPFQQAIIERALAGQDNFVLMPTGGGKSLCYQIPALLRPGVGIVVSPLISLMQDQVQALRANGVSAAFYNSSLDMNEARQILAQLHQGELDLLYLAPERLMTESFLARLASIDIALFAIDEAHCISQWGHDFRPEYVKLRELKSHFPQVPIMALTATADKQTRHDIVQHLHLQQAKIHVASFNRPNIRYTVVEKSKPLAQLLTFLKGKEHQSGIIYCATRNKTSELAQRLQEKGFNCAAYHGGLANRERARAQQAFQIEDVQIIVATLAFGMGIDKSNVRFVVHYEIPKNIEAYYQETGRAGRDGAPAEAMLLFGLGDVAKVRGIIDSNGPSEQQFIEKQKLNAMVGFAEAVTCRRQVLLNYFGEKLEQPCDNCDVCLDPLETYDATVEAQKALSCVYRVGQRFGLRHVIDVLRGADNQRVHQLGHIQLSTYGIGREQSLEHWMSLFRQLIHRGYLEQDISNYSVLKLTPQARILLKGEIKLLLAKPRVKPLTVDSKNPKVKRQKGKIDFEYDTELFEILRQLRKEIADREGVPPFIIFGDISLAEMASLLPQTEEAFLYITGVGQKKLTAYGPAFIERIKNYSQ